MNDEAASQHRSAARTRLGVLASLPFKGLSAGLDLALAPRGRVVLFLLAAAGLAAAGWVRPPLSSDLGGLHLRLGPSSGPVLEDLYGPRRIVPDSLGVFLLAVLAVVTLLVWLHPRRLGLGAGLLLCGAIGANAAVLLNHPLLLELLDLEQEQRAQMAHLFNLSDQLLPQFAEDPFTADASNTRVVQMGPPALDLVQPDPVYAYSYLLAGPWLVLWASLGVLLAVRGSLRRRLGYLLVWMVLAAGVASGLCSRRLWAEYHWIQATTLEGERDYQGSRCSLDQAVAIFPELEHLQRTWLLAGKLDRLEGKITPQCVFFAAYLLSHTPETARGLAMLEDLRAAGADAAPAIRLQAARAYTAAGVSCYYQTRFTAAQDAWRKAFQMVSENHDCLLGIAIVRSLADRGHPDEVEAELARLGGLADRAMRADVLTFLGHAYCEAGRFAEARSRYAASMDSFSLPKRINYGAQKGVGGL